MDSKRISDMADCMKRLLREQLALGKHNLVSGNFELTKSRRDSARESARECAIEIRRLKHEAHCLAVELGFSDRREESYYTDGTAPMGFGRTAVFTKRAPEQVAA